MWISTHAEVMSRVLERTLEIYEVDYGRHVALPCEFTQQPALKNAVDGAGSRRWRYEHGGRESPSLTILGRRARPTCSRAFTHPLES